MTPKEKAEQIYKQMLGDDGSTHPKVFGGVKRCALIAVDEIIRTLNEDIRDIDVRGNILLDLIDYWREVKQEIRLI